MTFSNGRQPEKSETVTPYHNVVFQQSGDTVEAAVEEGASQQPARFVLVAGQPLEQDIVQYGPFVQTTKQGIYDAISDYQLGRNGFERATEWESEIGKTMGRVH